MGKSYHLGGGKTGSYRRLAWDRPSPTVLTSPTMFATSLAHPVEDRPLSIQEYKRIQEFPDDWKLSGTLRQQYKQVGNAVPLGLGYAAGVLVMKLLNGERVEQFKDFRYSRYKRTSDVEWKEDFEELMGGGNMRSVKEVKKDDGFTVEDLLIAYDDYQNRHELTKEIVFKAVEKLRTVENLAHNGMSLADAYFDYKDIVEEHGGWIDQTPEAYYIDALEVIEKEIFHYANLIKRGIEKWEDLEYLRHEVISKW